MIVTFVRARAVESRRTAALAVVVSLLISIAIGSVLMLAAGKSPAYVWSEMALRTFGDPYLLGQMLYKTTGLIFTGLAVSLALDAGLFNIGVEGQVTAGVVGASLVGAALPPSTPPIVAVPLCLLAAAAFAGCVGYATGVLRVYRGAHEVITGFMLNAIIAGVALWLGNEFLFQNGSTRGPAIVPGARLPQLGFGGSAVNASLFLAILVAVAMWWIRSQTTWGRTWRAIGSEPTTARTVGIDVQHTQILAMVGSAALAGLSASNFVLGHKHAFEEGLGRGVGFLGIAAALLGRLNPLAIIAGALLFGFLSSGGLAVADIVPKELTEMLQGVVVLVVAVIMVWLPTRGVRVPTKGAP
ncbi:MAG TPA: ABC transporter permease [Kofleriaceae bacterium]